MAGLIVYANSCTGPFIIDDYPAVVENPDIRHWGGWWETIAVSHNSTISGRPLMWLTLTINYAIHDLDVWGYHAVNVGLHVVCMLLAYGIIRRTLLLPFWRDRFTNRAASIISAFIALLWGVHPLLTETVVYVSQRMELLAGAFYLLTLYACIRAWDSQKTSWYGVAIASTAIGLLAKEQVASAPVAALVYDCVFISGNLWAALRRHKKLYVGLSATWSIFIFLTSFGPRSAAVGFNLGMSSADYLRTQAGVLTHYLRLSFWPHPLCISYADWPVEHSWARSAPQGLMILALLGLTIWLLSRRSWIGFAGAWFFLILAPSSSVVPIITEIAAERRMYLPLLTIVSVSVAFGVWMLSLAQSRWHSKYVTFGMGVIGFLIITSAAAGTMRRNRDFQTAEGILGATLAARPGDELARGALMQEFAMRGELDRAKALYREGLAHDPNSQSVRYNWGECLVIAREPDAAIGEFQDLVRNHPENVRARRRLGQLLMSRGRAAEAVDHLQAGLWKSPEYFAGYNNLGVALFTIGRNKEAIAAFQTALELNPQFADAYYNLAGVLMQEQKWEDARDQLARGVELSVNDLTMRADLAKALEKSGDTQGAIHAYEEILRLDPTQSAAREQWARLKGSN